MTHPLDRHRHRREQAQERRRKAFTTGQQVSHLEHEAELLEDAVEARKQGFLAVMKGFEIAEGIDESDELKRELVRRYKADLAALARGEIDIYPFPESPEESGDSNDSSEKLPEAKERLPLEAPQKPALPSPGESLQTNGQVEANHSPRRPRGRPPGSKTKNRTKLKKSEPGSAGNELRPNAADSGNGFLPHTSDPKQATTATVNK